MAAYIPPLAVAALALAAAGCGAAEPTNPNPQDQPEPSPVARYQCADVYQPGQPIQHDKVQDGCLGPDGALHMPGTFYCRDGRRLWLVYGSSGAVSGWGFSSDVYVASEEPANDPGYIQAHAECVN